MGCVSVSTCSPLFCILGAFFGNKAADYKSQAEKLSKCPNCNSSNITKEELFYEKK
jgi:hypothetical protein